MGKLFRERCYRIVQRSGCEVTPTSSATGVSVPDWNREVDEKRPVDKPAKVDQRAGPGIGRPKVPSSLRRPT